MTSIHVHPRGIRTRPGLLQPRLVSRRGTSAHIALVAGGAMLVGGDRVDVEIDVADGCALLLEDVGGTVAYPSRGGASRMDIRITLGEGARMVWRSHPFVLADGALVERSTSAVLGADAALCLRETLVLGRSGERGGRLRLGTHVHDADGTPLLVEELDLDGTAPRPGILGSGTVLDSALLAGIRPPQAPDVPGVTVLDLARPGALAREIAAATHDSGIEAIWRSWSQGILDVELAA